MNQYQSGQRGSYSSPASWSNARPGRVIDSRTLEISGSNQLPEILSQAATIPGVKFSTYEDQDSGKTKVTLSFTAQASQRMQEVQQLHQRLTELSATENYQNSQSQNQR